MTKQEFQEQKTLASFLDTSASRSYQVGAQPATSKQCWFLAGLIIKSKDEATESEFVTNTNKVLTKREASTLIDSYLNA